MAALIAAALVLVVALNDGPTQHPLVVASQQARFMRPGLEVRIAGQNVGRVTAAQPTRAGTALVRLAIDDKAWPLPVGTRAVYRWAGTIAFTNRYVELLPPARSGPTLASGATIAGGDVTTTVEVDDVARLFDPRTRGQLRDTIDATGASLRRAAPELPAALERSPDALTEAHAVVEDLGADPGALATLLESTDRVVAAARAADPDVGALVDGLDRTFVATAQRAQALQQTLQNAPATLGEARATLDRAEPTLRNADATLARLSPGITQLRRAAAPLDATLDRVLDVAPLATRTLATLRQASPDLTALLRQATTVAPQLEKTATLARPQLACIRPYAPEVAGFAGTWNGFFTQGDPRDKYARTNAAYYPFQEGMGFTSADVSRQFPQLHYAFPRPPGEIANQPWFNEDCGVGPDAVDPTQDPEIDR